MNDENPLKVVLLFLVAGTMLYIFCDIVANSAMCGIQGKTSLRCTLYGKGLAIY